MNSTSAKLSVCVAIAVFASSCSYLTMQRPDKLEKDMPVCVSNRLAPSIDSTIAAGSAISTIVFAAIAADWATREPSGPVGTAGVAAGTSLFAAGSAVFGAAWTASAVSGFKRAKACEELKNNYVDERRAAHPPPRASPPMRNDTLYHGGIKLMAEEVKEECGEDPEVVMD